MILKAVDVMPYGDYKGYMLRAIDMKYLHDHAKDIEEGRVHADDEAVANFMDALVDYVAEEYLRRVRLGKVCPYCIEDTVLASSTEVYNRDYGLIYICRPCNAYVGVHRGTELSKGSVANAELRALRKEAHRHFDPVWRDDLLESKHKPRMAAYVWLANKLGIKKSVCHIGMMDIDQCNRVIELCQELTAEKVDHERPF